MKEKLLLAISILFHPHILAAFWMSIVVFNGTNESKVIWVFAMVLLLPVFLFKSWNIDLEKPSMQERRKIYLVLLLVYGIYLFLLTPDQDSLFSFPLILLTISWIIGLILLYALSFWRNISWHAYGVGLNVLVVFYFAKLFALDALLLTLAAVIISALVIYARWSQKAHTRLELFIGYTLGIMVALVLNLLPISLWIHNLAA